MLFRQQVSGNFLRSNECALDILEFHEIDYNGTYPIGRQNVGSILSSAGYAALTRRTVVTHPTRYLAFNRLIRAPSTEGLGIPNRRELRSSPVASIHVSDAKDAQLVLIPL